MFSSPSPSATAPPAYSELFPDQARAIGAQLDKQSPLETAVVDAVADEKCRLMYDRTAQDVTVGSAALSDVERQPKKAERSSTPSWLWVSELACLRLLSAAWLTGAQMPVFVVLTSIFMHAVMPYISTAVVQAIGSLQERTRVS